MGVKAWVLMVGDLNQSLGSAFLSHLLSSMLILQSVYEPTCIEMHDTPEGIVHFTWGWNYDIQHIILLFFVAVETQGVALSTYYSVRAAGPDIHLSSLKFSLSTVPSCQLTLQVKLTHTTPDRVLR